MSAEPPGLAEFQRKRRVTFYAKTDLPLNPSEIQELLGRKRRLMAEFAPLIQERSQLIFGTEAENVQPCPDVGTFHSLYKVRANGENWFLRADMLGVFGRACDLLIDQRISHLLQSRDFPTVQVLGTDLDRFILPFDFQVVAEAPGQRVKELEDPDTQSLPQGMLQSLGACLAEVHKWNVSGAGLLDPYYPLTGIHETWDAYILLNLEAHIAKCLDIGAINQTEAETIGAAFQNALPVLKHSPMRLLHGDFGHHNIFVEGTKVTGVIDWEDALGGDPVFDIAYWGTFVRSEMLGEFQQGYMNISQDEWPADFDQRYWLYYLRIALSKTVHRWLFSVQDRPGRPPASHRIQTALSELKELGAL